MTTSVVVHELLLRNNPPHVTYVKNREGDFEDVDESGPINVIDVLRGVAELNKIGIVLLDIRAGVSKEGVTKISSVGSAGVYSRREQKWIVEPSVPNDLDLPEGGDVIPFKSDSWALGEYMIRIRNGDGKGIPRRFLKSQTLLDKFIGGEEDDVLRKLLVLNPDKRAYTWDLVPPSEPNPALECVLM